MLEVKNLTKIYKGKKGAGVRALDDVSLRFPERGMVFLLGKSGSGKSTLLNVCGGLDAPTDGEVIVKGRSSRSFSGSDFDSYRNTFVGFIFQEYNILNEFSVEDNIALALELQGKSKRKKKKEIRELLEQVDLKGYAKRKPNTLSGGQKQRIAIARALVKSPEIIMADEPTGALDSNTGKQVFDTLKKLSESKLVIVVSHDREFAEIYADRIIELKDGKVISDVSKTELEQTVISENISEVDNVLCIKKGAALTDAELQRINSFLKGAEDDVIIARKESDVRSFKKTGRIKDNGSREVFSGTDETLIDKREYTPKENRFIRSKLPLKHAARIGVSGLKRKPIRLTMTVLLCTVAFTMFGVMSTLSFYDNEAVFKETLPNSGASMLMASKYYQSTIIDYENGEQVYKYDTYYSTRFNNEDVKTLNSQYGVETFGGVQLYGSDIPVKAISSEYWISRLNYMAYLPEGHSVRASMKYPTADNEIAISSYTADMLVESGFYDAEGNLVECRTAEDIIGKTVNLSGRKLRIGGIFDSGEIPEKYDALKTKGASQDRDLYNEFVNFLSDGTHLMVLASDGLIKELSWEDRYMYSGFSEYQSISSALYVTGSEDIAYPEWANSIYSSVKDNKVLEDTYWIKGAQSTLGDGEVILPVNLMYDLMMSRYEAEIKAHPEKAEEYEGIRILFDQLMMNGKDFDEETMQIIPFTDEERRAVLNELAAAINASGIGLDYGFVLFSAYGGAPIYTELPTLRVVGFYDGETKGSYPAVVFSENTYKSVLDIHISKSEYYTVSTSVYTVPEDAVYDVIFMPYNGTRSFTDMCWELYSNKEFGADGTRISVSSSFINTLEIANEVAKLLSTVFMWVGIILALFAALLFSNFISTSISYKKREIGILRAVGARGLDVFKIFFSESAVISAVCVLLSTVGSILVCNFINSKLSSGLGISLFVFGIPSFAVMLGIACITAVLATFLPVFNAARKKPVESIRAI